MASWRDLEPRVKVLQRRGLVVKSAYRGMGLPKYLQPALEGCDVYMVSAKGVSPGDTLCVVRLEWLEQLLAALPATDDPMKAESPHEV
jgi:hypothetical protein